MLPHVPTGVDRPTLDAIFAQLTSYPEGFTVHPKLGRQFAARAKQYGETGMVDWATAEAFAFGSLLLEGNPVLAERDLIVFDQRGTGLATPSLECPEREEAFLAALSDPAPFAAQTGERSVRFMARVIAAGLDQDYLGRPFPPMPELMAIAAERFERYAEGAPK